MSTWSPAVGGRNGCVWVSWWRITIHDRALAGSGPSSGSLAEPVSAIVSPTEKRCPATGLEMVTAGGSLPGWTLTVAVSVPPRPSDTVKVAVNIPACVYVWLTLAPLACGEPSPKFQS